MLIQQQVHDMVKRIVSVLDQPARIIMFGSYAGGNATEDSDLDLLVVESEFPDKASEYLRLKRTVGRIGVGVDLVLLTAV